MTPIGNTVPEARNNDHLEMGDLYIIETGNDLVVEMQALKEAQNASKSKYEKEQIAWNILTLTRKLNDTNLSDMKARAESELKKPNVDFVLKEKLDTFVRSVDMLKNSMVTVRKQADEASKAATISFLSQFDQMSAIAGTEVGKKEDMKKEEGKKEVKTETKKEGEKAITAPVKEAEVDVRQMDSFEKVADTLKTASHITKQVKHNADEIQAKLAKAPKKDDIKKIVEVLVDPKKTNKDFQHELSVPEDGEIGKVTIDALLAKAWTKYEWPTGVKETKPALESKHKVQKSKAPSTTSKAEAKVDKKAAPSTTPKVVSLAPVAPKTTEKIAIPTEKPETIIINKSIGEFNAFLKDAELDGRIKQEAFKARWVDTKDNDFSLVITEDGNVSYGVDRGVLSFNTVELSSFEKNLLAQLSNIVAKNKKEIYWVQPEIDIIK